MLKSQKVICIKCGVDYTKLSNARDQLMIHMRYCKGGKAKPKIYSPQRGS